MIKREPIGVLIARRRRALGRSQRELAEALCWASGWPTVTRHEVSRWERGRRVPTARWRAFLAEVLESAV
jgi:transcriptional regulator with XRE-family HTH domain